jgi:DNA (cytosine-5)-methyltransferase 1
MHEGGRSNLFFEFARIADELVRPGGYVLVENVPGLLSSNNGRDFAVVLATLAELGFHDLAWRVLDSRHFGVPQRRRRVFVVGRRARGSSCAEILLEPESGGGHFKTGREAGPDVAVASLSGLGSGGPDDNDRQGGRLIAPALVRRYGKGTDSDATDAMVVADTLTSGSHPGSNMPGRRREDDTNIVAFHGTQDPISGDVSPALGKEESGAIAVAYALRKDPGGTGQGHNTNYVNAGAAVRRLTPVECERLQGFPDNWTRLDDKTPDSRRYAALGDAVTVNVAEWIGRRLMQHVQKVAA